MHPSFPPAYILSFQASRGLHHKNGGHAHGGHAHGGHNKHDKDACVGALISSYGVISGNECGGTGKRAKKCCGGYMCKEEYGEVSVKTSKYLITSTKAPYRYSDALDNSCCLPEEKFDITELLCDGELEVFYGKKYCKETELVIKNFDSDSTLDNLACLCCEGKLKLETKYKNYHNHARYLCNSEGDSDKTGCCGGCPQ